MAVLISGVGRSGTTTLFQIIGKGLLNKYRVARCVYEPYLWNIPEIETSAVVKGQPFSVEQVGLFNVNVHCHTPLFLKDRNMLHDYWLQRVFYPIPLSSNIAPGNVMAKVIRGAGRLESALTKFDNLKVVIITRNVIDTINSALGMFSFYGDEFHPSDKTRFIEEVNKNFSTSYDARLIENELQWSTLWWHYQTKASIQTYTKYPDRVKLIPYEKYIKDKSKVIEEIFDFIGLEQSYIDKSLFEHTAGPTTSVSYLTMDDAEYLREDVKWYVENINKLFPSCFDKRAFIEGLYYKYSTREFCKSLLVTKPPNLTAVQWRGLLKIENNKAKIEKVAKPRTTFTVSAAIAEFGSNENSIIAIRSNKKDTHKGKVGVLITCFNSESSIANAIYSVLAQTHKVDLICVADDCSTDNTKDIVKNISKKFSQVSLVERPMNVGVAANRDLAIRAMDAEYISILDGDDLFYPEKIELELNAIENCRAKVAFSDIVVIGNPNHFLQDTAAYSGKGKDEILTMMTSRSVPVPRDMLFSKELFVSASGFDVGMSIYEDWAFKMRLVEAAEDGGWIHSGGKGTVYDRRQPGLSGKLPIEHAYGQLLVLARNVELLQEYPDVIRKGLQTVSNHMEGNMLSKMQNIIEKSKRTAGIQVACSELIKFWNCATFKNDIQYKKDQINDFVTSC